MAEVVRIALIDEDREDFSLVSRLLSSIPDRKYEIEWFRNSCEGLEALRRSGFDVYLLNERFDASGGLELLEEARRLESSKGIILLTGNRGERAGARGQDDGAYFLPKESLTPIRLEHSIRCCVRKARARGRSGETNGAKIEDGDGADRAKSAFLVNMSHEMRTPLGAIIGYTDLAIESLRSDPEINTYLRAIKANGDHLLNLVNDLLDIAKIETGHLRLQIEAFDWRDLVAQVVQMLEVRARAKNLALEFSCAPEIPALLVSDPQRVRQILLNIVGNAIKFTERGGVRIFARLLPAADEPQLAIDVIDTGLGISEEEASALFQPFRQVHRTLSPRYGGTGLGLDLSRKLAVALGGDVALHASAPEGGSTFRILLPANFSRGG